MKKLTAKKREALPASDFAVPGKRQLPIHDRQHAELAWKMVDGTEGLSSEEKATGRRRILARLRKLGVDVSGYATSSAAWAEGYLAAASAPGDTYQEGERVSLALEVEELRGPAYAVTLITAGDSLHGWRFPAEVLRGAVARFEGAASFVDHSCRPSLEKLVGVMSNVVWSEPAKALRGRLLMASTPAADWVESMVLRIMADREKGLPVPKVGLSADLWCQYHMDGRVRVADHVRNVYSVDVVFYPASGGAFDRVLNSVEGGANMVEEQELEGGQSGDNASGGDPAPAPLAAAGGEQVVANIGGGGGTAAGPAKAKPGKEPPGGGDGGTRGVDPTAAAEQAEAMLRAQCSTLLDGRLMWSELPQPVKDGIRVQFSGRIFTPEQLDAEIERQRGMLAGLLEEGVVVGMGEGRPDDPGRAQVFGMTTSLERVQMAFDRMMGLEVPEEFSDIPRLSGIRELYLLMTGDHDFYGQFYPERVKLANVTTASMTSIVKNALNKVLLQAYNVRPRWWDRIVYHEDFGSLNQITWMKTGGFGTLPTVSEGAAYTEIDWSDAEETGDFLKKGGYIGITLEMMDRDDVGSVKRIPRELGNAAWRTLSGLVSALFTDNSDTGPTMGCTHNVFDAGNHTNLLTTALSQAQWDVVIQAVFQQTEPTSGAVLAIRPKFLLVPIELEKTGLSILEQPWAMASNVHYLDVRYQSGRVVVVPEWTDANNWAAVCDPNDCPGICIGYRYGRDPELFVADEGTVGSMFTNDEMRIKVRFFVAVGVADYRPLHKSNVS